MKARDQVVGPKGRFAIMVAYTGMWAIGGAAAINRHDINQWAADQGIVASRKT